MKRSDRCCGEAGCTCCRSALFALLAVGFYGGLETDTTVLPSALIDQAGAGFRPAAVARRRRTGFSSGRSRRACQPRQRLRLVVRALPRRAPGAERAGRNRSACRSTASTTRTRREAARAWIAELGNPYTRIGADDGRVGIDWGVYGVPETFVVDRQGRIRYKHVGPLTQADLDRKILPLDRKAGKMIRSAAQPDRSRQIVIPAKAGIHCGNRTEQRTDGSRPSPG